MFRKIAIYISKVATLLSGCVIVQKPTSEELDLLDNPPVDIAGEIDQLMPQALDWYYEVESLLSAKGRTLSATEKERANELGVLNPDRIRVVVLDQFPMPSDEVLRKKAESYGLGSQYEGARTIGYVVMLKPAHKDNSTILSHELVHVAQHDQMGRKNFLRRYVIEMEIMGYSRSPLELEANKKQRKISATP